MATREQQFPRELQATLRATRECARVVVIGAPSSQFAPGALHRSAPVQLILRSKFTLRGYSTDDDPDLRDERLARFGARLNAGSIVFPHTTVEGLAAAPAATRGRHPRAVIVTP